MIDFSTPLGQRAEEHLHSDPAVWLTVIGADGMPQPSPVWFYWDGSTLLIYSQPKAKRLLHIAKNPKVSLHFITDREADEVIVLTGEAHLAPDAPPADRVEGYLKKYAGGIARLGWTQPGFAADFSVPFRVTPMHLRGDLG